MSITLTQESVVTEMARPEGTKALLLVMDGLGGYRTAERGSELTEARTPNLDRLAGEGSLGLHDPVTRGITPGSGAGHLGLFGYDPLAYEIGRGALSAAGIGFELQPGDVAARVNFCTLDADGDHHRPPRRPAAHRGGGRHLRAADARDPARRGRVLPPARAGAPRPAGAARPGPRPRPERHRPPGRWRRPARPAGPHARGQAHRRAGQPDPRPGPHPARRPGAGQLPAPARLRQRQGHAQLPRPLPGQGAGHRRLPDVRRHLPAARLRDPPGRRGRPRRRSTPWPSCCPTTTSCSCT